MLRILGSTKQLCQGITRRDMMRIGGLGIGGISLAQMLSLQEASAAQSVEHGKAFGKAKGLILIHLYGSPSQLEWVDCKPTAPVEIRGDLKTIPSSLKGCDVCELLPNLAKVMDRTTVLRSLTHPYPIHGVAFALTGVPAFDVNMELSPQDPRHWPYFGSVIEYLDSRQRAGEPVVPSNIALPFHFSTKRVGEVPRAGPYAAFLGSQFDPLWADFQGTATKEITKTLRVITYTRNGPYIGIAPDSYYVVPDASSLRPELTLDRLNNRRSLLGQLNDALPHLETTSP